VTDPLAARRRGFAEELGAAAHLPAPLVEAFARVSREHFLGPGPWLVWGEGQQGPQTTPDADPARVYVNSSIAIDAERQLFNGLPSFLGMSIAALALEPGHHVLHIGPGLGYYTAVMGELVRPDGSAVLYRRLRVLLELDRPGHHAWIYHAWRSRPARSH